MLHLRIAYQFRTSHVYIYVKSRYPMLVFITKLEGDGVMLITTLWTVVTGYIELSQSTLHSTGTDLIVWPGLLIAAWWVLIGKTRAILKLFSIPIIAVATYFILFISYHFIVNLS